MKQKAEAVTVFKKFMKTFSIWERSLKDYTTKQFSAKPNDASWSIGQLYRHLIDETLYYNIGEIRTCLSNNRNRLKEKSEEGKEMFERGGFPPIKIRGPVGPDGPKQPATTKEVEEKFAEIKKALIEIASVIPGSKFNGKTKHPGWGYMNAIEWLQFIEMHFRHHLRQKKRIDNYLRKSKLKSHFR